MREVASDTSTVNSRSHTKEANGRSRLKAMLVATVIVVAACGGSPDSVPDAPSDSPTPTNVGTTAPDATTTTTPAETQPSFVTGSATLVVGDRTFEFDNYYCAQGSSNTGNAAVSFSSGAFGDYEGTRIQLDVSILDFDEQNRMEGDGTTQSVTLDDVEDFENPSVGLRAISGVLSTVSFLIQYDGTTVTAEALFDDSTTDEIEEIPGTLTATCGG